MTDKPDMAGLSASHKTLNDATEALATFISITRSYETPPESLIEAANKTVDDLAEWRAKIKKMAKVVDLDELARGHKPH